MTKFIHKIGGMVAGVAFGALAFTSCSEQIDESNLYTFTGETITDYLRSDSTLRISLRLQTMQVCQTACLHTEPIPASLQPTRR